MIKTTPLSRRGLSSALVCAALAAAWPLSSQAADPPWPAAKPITWIVGFAAGGTTDVLTRAVARLLSEKTGQPVVVENKPGASGALALQYMTKATPDGYTLITVPGPVLFPQQVPEVGRELQAVALLAQGPMVLVAPTSNAQPPDLQALMAAVRKNPQAWSYATSGTGTSQHLAGELLNQMAETKIVHIPYKGGGQAIADVVGGQVPLALLGAAPVLPHLRSGKLKAYGVTSSFRLDSLAQVPTFAEAGFKGYDATQWFVVAVPRGTPPDITQQLNQSLVASMASPALKDVLYAAGSVPVAGSAQDATQFIARDNAKWRALVQQIGMKLD